MRELPMHERLRRQALLLAAVQLWISESEEQTIELVDWHRLARYFGYSTRGTAGFFRRASDGTAGLMRMRKDRVCLDKAGHARLVEYSEFLAANGPAIEATRDIR